MSDLVAMTADALLPFLAAGGAAVGAGMADQAGSDLYKAATRLLGKLSGRLRGTDRAGLETAIRAALADGSVSQEELEDFRTAYAQARQNVSGLVVGSVDAEVSIVGNADINTLNIGKRE